MKNNYLYGLYNKTRLGPLVHFVPVMVSSINKHWVRVTNINAMASWRGFRQILIKEEALIF